MIFHNGVPIGVISKGDMMKLIAVQRQNFGMLDYYNKAKKVQQEGLHLPEEGQQEVSEEEEKVGNLKG